MSRESTIRKGLRRDQIPAGELLGRHNANLLLQLLGAACNMELVGGQVLITENKIMLKPGPGSGGSSSGGIGTLKVYSSADTFAAGDLRVIRPLDAIVLAGGADISNTTKYALPGIWVCTQANAPTAGGKIYVPHWPPAQVAADSLSYDPANANVFWWPLSLWPKMQFAITTLVDGDYFKAKPWDGTTLGSTEVNIAKAPLARSIASETIDGVPITYGSYSNNKMQRSASDGTNVETQVIYPRYNTKQATGSQPSQWLVDAYVPLNGTGITVAGVPVVWQELDRRVWARRFTQ